MKRSLWDRFFRIFIHWAISEEKDKIVTLLQRTFSVFIENYHSNPKSLKDNQYHTHAHGIYKLQSIGQQQKKLVNTATPILYMNDGATIWIRCIPVPMTNILTNSKHTRPQPPWY